MLFRIVFCLTMIFFNVSSPSIEQEPRPTVKSLLNREIRIEDNFAGESITLLKENEHYYILHKIFGSGVPVVKTLKYKVNFRSNYQLSFDVADPNNTIQHLPQTFTLNIENKGFSLYLNGIKVYAEFGYGPEHYRRH